VSPANHRKYPRNPYLANVKNVIVLFNSAVDDFNNAVVLTSRPLRPREMFEIQLDKMVDKWAGSIEIGVTSHSPLDIEFPATMTNIRSGTWMMTGNGVMHNGRMIREDYGQNLDALKVCQLSLYHILAPNLASGRFSKV